MYLMILLKFLVTIHLINANISFMTNDSAEK